MAAREATERAQARLVEAIDGISDAILLVGPDRILVSWNESFARILLGWGLSVRQGLTYDDIVESRLRHGVYRTGAADLESIRQEQLAIFGSCCVEFEERLSDGSWLRTSARKTKSGDTTVVFRDVSEDKKRETEIRRLSAAVEQSGSMISIVRPDGRIEYVNRKWTEATGFSAEEAVGRTPEIVGSGKTPRTLYKELWERLSTGQTWTGEILNRRKSGELYWCREIISPFLDRDDRITHFVSIREDVTQRRQLDDDLKSAKELAEASSRAKTQFLANMSHELRTPLNAVLGFSEMIRDELLGPVGHVKYKDYAEDIHRAGSHLLDIINDVLDTAKIEAGKLTLAEQPVSVRAAVDSTMRLARGRLDGGQIPVRVEISEHLPLLWADLRLLKRILLNLLSNALKFTSEGEIVVSGRISADGWMEIAVRDTGIGIAEADIPKVLQPFHQVDNSNTRKHQGTGLGLNLALSLVELHEGELQVASVVGKGTTVTCRFPPQRIQNDDVPPSALSARAVEERGM